MSAKTLNKRMAFLPNSRAFTLIELLLVLVILAVLFTLAAPSGREMLIENRTIAHVNTLIGALYYARTEAIQRNKKIIFCKSADRKTCGGAWRDGQIAVDESGRVLRGFSALPKGDSLIWNSSRGKDDYVEWLSSGYTNGQRGTFYYCVGHADASYSQEIILLNTGRVYVAPITAEDYAEHCPHG